MRQIHDSMYWIDFQRLVEDNDSFGKRMDVSEAVTTGTRETVQTNGSGSGEEDK